MGSPSSVAQEQREGGGIGVFGGQLGVVNARMMCFLNQDSLTLGESELSSDLFLLISLGTLPPTKMHTPFLT